jgi:hypothetical protein
MHWREMLPRWHPLHRDKPEPEPEKFAFCETALATGTSPWHIRQLGPRGARPGGGTDTPALCGRPVSWDVRMKVSDRPAIALGHQRGACKECALIYRTRKASPWQS